MPGFSRFRMAWRVLRQGTAAAPAAVDTPVSAPARRDLPNKSLEDTRRVIDAAFVPTVDSLTLEMGCRDEEWRTIAAYLDDVPAVS